ncbi:regulatory protein SipA [Dapis sp. BLCC M126]|uniref:regulatory protein SipA n=1 Tax=Dapis sp. BLCC M126 TaxID=3400189 RepID=UPI003CEC1032
MENEFSIGQKVRLVVQPPYIKTAESMPILRPPNVVRLGEVGTILSCKAGNYLAVRFEKGAFLIDSQYIEAVTVDSGTAQPHHTDEDTNKITKSSES